MSKTILRELIFSVTNRCNHACKMCYYHESLAADMSELSLDEIRRVSDSLGPMERLWISGGEPLVRAELIAICEVFHRNNGIRHVFLPTNGSFPQRLAQIAQTISDLSPTVGLQIMFSLEGREDQHDHIHARAGAFQKVAESAALLKRLRLERLRSGRPLFSVSMNTVVTDQNIEEVPPLMKWVEENLWVDIHTFTPVRGSALDPAYSLVDADAFADLIEKAKPFFRRYLSRSFGMGESSGEALRALESRYGNWVNVLRGGSLRVPCVAGKGIGVLEPNGGVRICELKPIVGNVRDAGYEFGAIWNSAAAQGVKSTVPGCACTHGCFISASEKQAGVVPNVLLPE